FNKAHLRQLRQQAEDLFDHGWDNYFKHAFPLDELKPLSCIGLGPDPDPSNIGINDVLGGYALTLIDSLDMLPLMNRQDEFAYYIQLIEDTVSFNVSSTIQVFEVTIRVIGGLLSGHIYASSPRHGHAIEGYNGHLLKLAYDLAKRLLPAFDTPSGIPHPRVNLMHGVIPIDGHYITETCSSGAGSLLLEFGLLSKLTGDLIFEKVAKRAFMALWQRRSPLGLIGMSIDSQSGEWQSSMTGVGASIDSYYEYAIKAYAVSGDRDYFSIFNTMDTALSKYSYDGWLYKSIDFYRGTVVTGWIDSLAAFYPIVNVLSGDISRAVSTHLVYWKLWNTYAGIPERWNFVDLEWYPLRPEFIESNYYLYTVTRDPFFLQVGVQVMNDLVSRNKVKCGFAGVQDVRTGKLSNRMESFYLSETVKYLYLLFDFALGEDGVNFGIKNKGIWSSDNFVFSTEGHPLWYDNSTIKSCH
ncbi:glycoside hydrolase, partial [Nadsonia fulvescens var. elongata DSM 6958]